MKKKIKEPVEDIEILPCLTLMNVNPEKLKHGIVLVRKCKISCHHGEDFVTSF